MIAFDLLAITCRAAYALGHAGLTPPRSGDGLFTRMEWASWKLGELHRAWGL